MITKAQALTESDFHSSHYTNSDGTCRRWRRNGATKVWKREPERFRIPIKYGLRGYDAITELNASHFHLASECPYE